MHGEPEDQDLDRERHETLAQLDEWLEKPMAALGFVWLALLVLELTLGLSPALELATTAIWVVFLLEFGLRLALAPAKLAYLRRNWLTVVALALPALRVLRLARLLPVLRAARAARGVRLVRVVSSLNRGMRALGAAMGRRGAGYVAVLTLLVTFGGAAGMYAFESDGGAGMEGFDSYGEALWWTAMVMTTLGSQAWPATPEGRLLCFLLALYAFAAFGYVTATLASFFVDRDAESAGAAVAGAADLRALRGEIAALRAEVAALGARLPGSAAERPVRSGS